MNAETPDVPTLPVGYLPYGKQDHFAFTGPTWSGWTSSFALGREPETVALSNLGVIGGDLAGYPNGRRLGDDVVDISLRAVMGVLISDPNTPPLVMVKVPPVMSSRVSLPSRAFLASSLHSTTIWLIDFWSTFSMSNPMGAPVVSPSNTPERILTSSGSRRWVVKRFCPGFLLSRYF